MVDNFGILDDDQKSAMIPYYVHEGEMSRMERINLRLWILILIIFLALVATNAAWIIYENQFGTETVTQTSYEATSDSGSAVLNGSGEVRIYGGTGESHQDSDGSTGEDCELTWTENLP